MKINSDILAYIVVIIICLIMQFFQTGTGRIVRDFISNDYAKVTDVEYKAVLLDDETNGGGDILVTEKLTFDIHAADSDNLFWELWRALPESYVDGLKVDYDVNYVKQIYEDGSEFFYQESDKLYWDDSDYTLEPYGPFKWYHSKGPYNDYDRFESVLIYVDGLYREEVTFEIQYVMHNAALKYNDVSQLYLTLYSEETINYLDSYKAEILIPHKDMPSDGNYYVSTYGTKNYRFDFKESDTVNLGYHTFSIDLDEDDLDFTLDTEYIEFSLLAFNEDKHIFTDYAPDNDYTHTNYLEEVQKEIEEYYEIPKIIKEKQIKILVVSVVICLIVFIFIIRFDKNVRKKYSLSTSKVKMDYFRDIPSDLDPYFAAFLVSTKQNKKIDISQSYSALMLSLARKGYIELLKIDNSKDWVFDNIKIKTLYVKPVSSSLLNRDISTINKSNKLLVDYLIKNNNNKDIVNYDIYNVKGKKLEKLTINEEVYYNLIARYANKIRKYEITMKEFQTRAVVDYDIADSFLTSIENSIKRIGLKNNYFLNEKYNLVVDKIKKTAKVFCILGILMSFFANLILYFSSIGFDYGGFWIIGIVFILYSLYLNKISKNYVLFTQIGEEESVKWNALYNFLNSETLMNERDVVDLVLWEKYLVYATAFGISDKVVKALQIRCPNININQSVILSNNYYSSSNFRSYNHSFSRRVSNASHTSRSSRYNGGYYGGGGSFGGAGRGGGGGGGGH